MVPNGAAQTVTAGYVYWLARGHRDSSPIQKDLLCGFMAGTQNLLVTTKSCEDIDVPPLSMVIKLSISLVAMQYC